MSKEFDVLLTKEERVYDDEDIKRLANNGGFDEITESEEGYSDSYDK